MNTSDIKYPNIKVQLEGRNGNAFSILGAARKAMRENGLDDDEIKKYTDEATSGDYDHLIQTTMLWLNVDYYDNYEEEDDDYDNDNVDDDDDDYWNDDEDQDYWND